MPNTYTNGWFWAMMLFGISIVIFIMTSIRTSADRAFATAGFGSFIFGTFLFYLGFINWLIYSITIFLMVGGIVAMIVRQEQEY